MADLYLDDAPREWGAGRLEGVAKRTGLGARSDTWSMVVVGVVVGGVAAHSIVLGGVLAIALPAVRLASSPLGRLALVVMGGLVTLGPATFTPTKAAYLAGVVVCVVFAVNQLRGPLLSSVPVRASAAYGAVLAVSALFGLGAGNQMSIVLADTSVYALLGVVSVFAIGASQANPRHIELLLMCAGSLALFSFTFGWIARRGYGSDLVGDALLKTDSLGLALGAYAFAHAVCRRDGQWGWVLASALSFGVPLATGTRTLLVQLTAPAFMLVILGMKRRRLAGRGVFVVLLVLASSGVLAFATAQLVSGTTANLAQRVSVLQEALRDPQGDQSLAGRTDQLRAALVEFVDSPVVGVGPGYVFEVAEGSEVKGRSRIDTGFAPVAKLGLLGSSALLYLLWAWRRMLSRVSFTVWSLGTAGWALAAMVQSLIVPVVEDKGFGFAAMLLLSGSLASARNGRELVEDKSALVMSSVRARVQAE